MRVLLFTLLSSPFKGGAENYYCNILKYWPDQTNIKILNNQSQSLIKNWLWPKWLPAIKQLWQTIRKNKIEYILVGEILPFGTVTYLVTKLTKTPYTIILHGTDLAFALKYKRKEKIALKILDKADIIICANSYVARQVGEFIENKNKISVVNPGINPMIKFDGVIIDNLKNKYRLHNKLILFSLGRLVERKGFDKVIKVLPDVIKKVPNIKYLIAGAGHEYNNLNVLIKKLNLKDRVIMLGKVNEEEKWALLKLCDIFISPSREINGDVEGFGIVFLEANLAGKPVIAGDSGGVRDAVEDHVNGILIDPESEEAIADGILELALNQRLRQKLGQQGWRRAIEKFNWEKQIRAIYSIINNT